MSRRVWRIGGAVALLFLLLAGTAGAGLWWSLRSAAGTAWLLSKLPGVAAQGVRGPLLGDFEAERVVVTLPGPDDSVTLTGLGWRGLDIGRVSGGSSGSTGSGSGTPWARIVLDELHIARVDVKQSPKPADPNKPPLAAPADLRLPVELELKSLRVGEVHAAALGAQPVRDLLASLHLGAAGGAEHRVELQGVAWDKLAASGKARIASNAPMALDASLDLMQRGTASTDVFQAHATLAGPIASPTLQATLRAQPSADKPAQSLDAKAVLRPFAAWPLGDLQATARALDASAFSSAAPRTALDIDASAASSGLDQPANLSLNVVNADAGRWSEARLPLQRLQLEAAAKPGDTSQVELKSFTAELGSAAAPAGRIGGSGQWTAARWNIDLALAALRPARLDARAPEMTLDGPLKVTGSGFDAASADKHVLDVLLDLKGSLAGSNGGAKVSKKGDKAGSTKASGPAHAVQVKLDASLSTLRVELRDARATASAARATLAGTVLRSAADAPWSVKGEAALVEFDPALWLPGLDAAAWKKGPNRLNAKSDFALTLPADVAQRPTATLLPALRGQLTLKLADSQLAGVPLSADIALRSNDGKFATPTLKLVAGGNSVAADGRIDLGKSADRWNLRVDAPTLATLAPLYRLLQPAATPPASAAAQFSGTLLLDGRIEGRWPALKTEGTFDARSVQAGSASIAKAGGRWRLGTSAESPVEAQIDVTDAKANAKPSTDASSPALESLSLTLAGTGRAHTLSARAVSTLQTPAWADALAQNGVPAAAAATPAAATLAASAPSSVTAPAVVTASRRTVALVQARGGLIDLPAAPFAGWRGTLQQIDLRSNATRAAPLLALRNVGIESFWAGGPARLKVDAGRAAIAGAALSWSRIAWQAAGPNNAPAQIEASARLEPLAIAPLIAQFQPSLGLSGDLKIAGRLELRNAAGLRADIALERASGDLTLTDEARSQALGLSDLSLTLAADNGVWTLKQSLKAKLVGDVSANVVVRTTPQALVPPPEAALSGKLNVRVAELGSFSNFIPAGWRVEGQLGADAAISGQVGAPLLTGNISGQRLAVSNFLQGVNIGQGELAIALRGTQVHIERFNAKAGDGTLNVSGDASLGAAPKADLKLTAERFQLLGRLDRRIVASGQADLRFDRDNIAVDGKFRVDQGLIDFTRGDAPALGDDVVVTRNGRFVGATRADATEAPAPASVAAKTDSKAEPATARKVAMNLVVNLGQQLSLRGRGLDTRLEGELRITSPDGKVAVNGSVATADGVFQAYGQKMKIDRGVVTFAGSTDNPRLDIEATRPNDVTSATASAGTSTASSDYQRVGVKVTGTASNPRVRLFSEPQLSDVDTLSWLVMGRASDGLGRTDTALLQRAALALVSGEGPGTTDKLTQALGLDALSISPGEGGVRDSVISLGKQLSKRFYVGYEHSLNATGGNWQLIYRLAQRLTVKAQTGLDNAVDFNWTLRWQ